VQIVADLAIMVGEDATLSELTQHLPVKILTVVRSMPPPTSVKDLLDRTFDPEDEEHIRIFIDFVEGFRGRTHSVNQIEAITGIIEGDSILGWRVFQIRTMANRIEHLWIKETEKIIRIRDFVVIYNLESLCGDIQFICKRPMVAGYMVAGYGQETDLNEAFELRNLEDLIAELSNFLEL
jgi:hypothetical protein